jgi:hypothetical protein
MYYDSFRREKIWNEYSGIYQKSISEMFINRLNSKKINKSFFLRNSLK